jgi:hypothetical protein
MFAMIGQVFHQFDLPPLFDAGLEVSRRETRYAFRAPGEAARIET